VSDWTEGWRQPGKGRIYRVYDPDSSRTEIVRETGRLIAEGMGHRPLDELARLLGHPDSRVRQEAQFALAAKGKDAIETLARVARGGSDPLARLHAIWGLGQVGRRTAEGLEPLVPLLTDSDAEVRAQAVRTLCDGPLVGPQVKSLVLARLGDESPRVRMFAAIGLGKLGGGDVVGPLVQMLRADGADPTLRHAAVMGLVGSEDVDALGKAAAHESPLARMGVLLAFRRLGRPEVSRFLDDRDPALVLEAARAINDAPIEGAMPRLAAMLDRPKGLPEPLLLRAINANLRIGGPAAASRLAGFAASADAPKAMRVEALGALTSWPAPAGRDRVVGLWRPISPHPAEEAVAPLRRVLPEILAKAPDVVRQAGARSAAVLGVKEAGTALLALVGDSERSGAARAEAIKALEAIGDDRLEQAMRTAVDAEDPMLRVEGRRLLAKLKPNEAVPALEAVLGKGETAERQAALAILGGLDVPAADAVLARWLDKLLADEVPADVQLDLVEAAAKRSAPEVKDRLSKYEASRPEGDAVARYREALAGGDAERGRKVFANKAEVECIRCHKISRPNGEGYGGDVGPDLTDIGSREPRDYILESIVDPNRKITKNFESAVVALTDGRLVAGIVKLDDGKRLRLQTPQGHYIEVNADEVEDRKAGLSGMPEDLIKHLSKSEIRDLVEFLSTMKQASGHPEPSPE
jgi:quinoprotein glucose dehydrogenase